MSEHNNTNTQTVGWVVLSSQKPPQKPSKPYGVTALDIMRSCPARVCFEYSPEFKTRRRLPFAARIGSAFHRTMQNLSSHLASYSQNTIEDMSKVASDLFLVELEKERTLKEASLRERFLPEDQNRINHALDAVIIEAQRIFSTGFNGIKAAELLDASNHISAEYLAQNEVAVRSKDGYFVGRIDRIERTPNSLTLIDYKSALRADVPERYKQQLQFYAWLWYDNYGEWVTQARLIYPFTRSNFEVDVTPEKCQEVANDCRKVVNNLERANSFQKAATPGEVCSVCEFRPWCNPFWNRQNTSINAQNSRELVPLGIEVVVNELTQVGERWKLLVKWQEKEIRMFPAQNRFPHLGNASKGQTLRVLGVTLEGNPPLAKLTDYSEIFLVE